MSRAFSSSPANVCDVRSRNSPDWLAEVSMRTTTSAWAAGCCEAGVRRRPRAVMGEAEASLCARSTNESFADAPALPNERGWMVRGWLAGFGSAARREAHVAAKRTAARRAVSNGSVRVDIEGPSEVG